MGCSVMIDIVIKTLGKEMDKLKWASEHQHADTNRALAVIEYEEVKKIRNHFVNNRSDVIKDCEIQQGIRTVPSEQDIRIQDAEDKYRKRKGF